MARTADERKKANAVSSRESRKRKSEQLDYLRDQISDYKRRLWDAEKTNAALVRVLRTTLTDRASAAPSTNTMSAAVSSALSVLNGPLLNPPIASYQSLPLDPPAGVSNYLNTKVEARTSQAMGLPIAAPIAPMVMNNHSVVFNSGPCKEAAPCSLINVGQTPAFKTGYPLAPQSSQVNYCVVPAYDSNQHDTDAASHAACWTVEKALSGTSEEGISSEESATAVTCATGVTPEEMAPVSARVPTFTPEALNHLDDEGIPLDLFDISDQGLSCLIDDTAFSTVGCW